MCDLAGERTGLMHGRGTRKGAGKMKGMGAGGYVFTTYPGKMGEEGHRDRRQGWMWGKLGLDRTGWTKKEAASETGKFGG